MPRNADREGLRRAVADNPDDPEQRRIYADLLWEQGDLAAACLHRWLATLGPALRTELLVFDPACEPVYVGQTWESTWRTPRGNLARRVATRFQERPGCRYLIVGRLPAEPCGLVAHDRSPLLYWDWTGDRLQPVLPQVVGAAEAAELVPLPPGEDLPPDVAEERRFGQCAEPCWQ
jgi:uncharacterized protein (TIGR02996 family)